MSVRSFLGAGAPRPVFQPSDEVFDAHCHVLNLEYLLVEGVQILSDMVHGEYPLSAESEFARSGILKPDFERRDRIDEAESFLAWILQIAFAAFRGEEANVKELRRAGSRVWQAPALNLVPLMMDVYYMFSSPRTPVGWQPREVEPAVVSVSRWDKHTSALKKRIAEAVHGLRERFSTGKSPLRTPGTRIGRILEGIAQRVLRDAEDARDGQGPGFTTTAGFRRQYRAIESLGAPGTRIYPFFAVDARRPGVVEWVVSSGKVGRNGPFYGIKLYPRLGCHPLHPSCEPLFEFCARRGVPITTHTSYRGFPEWLTRYAEFGQPENFRPIFEKYPGMRINFAHFGDRAATDEVRDVWSREIVTLMKDFPGAYADLSCFTHNAAVERYKERAAAFPSIRERTMFGSDFDVLFFTEPGMTLEKYYRRFRDAFGTDELRQMACTVPRKFLGL